MDAGGLVRDEESDDTATLDCLTNTDDTVRYTRCIMFRGSISLILNGNLYLGGEWSELV